MNTRRDILILVCIVGANCNTTNVKADFGFGEPVNLESIIPILDGTHDIVDCFSSDGLELYIESDRPGAQGGQGDWDLWVISRATTDSDWGPAVNLGPAINSPSVDALPFIAADGLTLYFDSNRSGGYGSYDIYMTTRATKNAPWGPPVNMGPKINTSAADGNPWVSQDGLEFYFGSFQSGGYGGEDIYVMKRTTTNDSWGEPLNLGPIVNSAYQEHCLCLSPDGLLLIFCDNQFAGKPRPSGYGDGDMWMTKRKSFADPWQPPVNLGPKLNGANVDGGARFSPDGSSLCWWSNRSGGWRNYHAPILPICDFNGDGKADGKDVLGMASQWETNDSLCDIGPYAWGDGIVDLQDLIVLAEYLGKEVTDSTLLARWALDETEGARACDSAGTNHGIVMGGPLWQPAGGQVDGAIQLDGVDDCIVAASVLNPAKGPLSVLAWIKGGAPGQVVVSESRSANWLMADSEGYLATELTSSGRLGGPLESQTTITDGKWHRIGLIWDGLNRMLVVDGVIVAEDTQEALPSSANSLYIGVGKDYAGTFWSGQVDDVRIYSRAVAP